MQRSGPLHHNPIGFLLEPIMVVEVMQMRSAEVDGRDDGDLVQILFVRTSPSWRARELHASVARSLQLLLIRRQEH